MTIVFDANPNRSTKAMQGQEEGRGLAFQITVPRLKDAKEKHNFAANHF